MTNDRLKQLTQVLKENGYNKLSINKDEYARLNGVITSSRGKKYFLKAVIGKNGYEYKSLYLESEITKYLSVITKKNPITYKGYRLYIPDVVKVIDRDEVFCLITEYVRGEKLLRKSSDVQAGTLFYTLELITILSRKVRKSKIKPFLKNYTRRSLLFFLPFRFIKAVMMSPFAFRGLTIATFKTLPLFLPNRASHGLIHPDINASNIICHEKDLYLTDWEEAGWGLSVYNKSTPLCVHWRDETLRKILFNKLQVNGYSELFIPLLAYRALMLFNQNMERKNKKRKRDLALLKFLETV